jgi:hypothetical protein
MARNVVSPNSSGPVARRPHPESSTERGDPRRPYTDTDKPEARQDKSFGNIMMGGGGGMDRDSQPTSSRTDDSRQFAKDAVDRHLLQHRRGWKR